MGYRLAATAVCAFSVVAAAAAACSSSSSSDDRAGEQIADAASDAAPVDATTETAAADTGEPDDAGADGPVDSGPDVLVDASDAGPCDLDLAGEPTELRCTGLYSDWGSRTISSAVQVYDPGLHLWSDGAVKTRWVYLPPGTTIDTSNMDEWTFPVGTKFWKQFVVGGVLIETRLLHKVGAGNWYATTYLWSSDASSTIELTTGAPNVNDAGYEVPSQAKCTQCHQGRADYVLGFEAVSLSSPGASGLPMATLVARNLLTAPPDAGLAVPGNPVESAALGYLHANCGITCHNPTNGLAHTTGLFMRLNVSSLASVGATDTYKTAWNVPTTGFHVVPERLAQCSPASSCVYYRMSHRDGLDGAPIGTQMPPIDTHQVDPTGEAILTAWLDEGCDAGVDGGP